MEEVLGIILGIFKFIFELLARMIFEIFFHRIIRGTGLRIQKLFGISINVKDEMDEIGAGCLTYTLGISFYILVIYLIISIF